MQKYHLIIWLFSLDILTFKIILQEVTQLK